jgi:hypothetical protein
VKSFIEIAEPFSINSTPDAIRAIEKLVSETSYHGEGLTALNAINNWLSKKERDRISTAGSEVQQKLGEATHFVRKFVLLGLEGLIWWAEHEEPNQGAEMGFRNARIELIECLNYLEGISDTLRNVAVGSDVVLRIENLWERLRKQSHRFGPEFFLSQNISSADGGPTILEKWMPEFFCLPFEMLKKLSMSFLSQVQVTNNWESSTAGLSLVMATVPLGPAVQIFELLLADMKSHGGEKENVIQLQMNELDGSKSLIIDFLNRVRSDDVPGTRRSQSKVRALSIPLGLEIDFDAPREPGELYKATVRFPQVISVKCY